MVLLITRCDEAGEGMKGVCVIISRCEVNICICGRFIVKKSTNEYVIVTVLLYDLFF